MMWWIKVTVGKSCGALGISSSIIGDNLPTQTPILPLKNPYINLIYAPKNPYINLIYTPYSPVLGQTLR